MRTLSMCESWNSGVKPFSEGHPAVDRADVRFPVGEGDVDEAVGRDGVAGEIGRDQPRLEGRAVEEFLEDARSVIGTLAVAGDDDAGRSVRWN